MLYCFLGGLEFVFGAWWARSLVTIFELQFQQYQTLIYGLLMILLILWLPNGILSLSLGRATADEEVDVPQTGPGAEKEAAE